MTSLKLAFRSLQKTTAFTITAIVTLALGIGACTTIFSVIETVMLRPLPMADQGRLVVLWQANPGLGISRFGQSIPNFFDYRNGATTLDGLSAVNGFSANVTVGDHGMRLEGAEVTRDFTGVMGWTPLLGRTFLPEEDEPGARRVVLISSGFWETTYNGDPGVLGTMLAVNGEPHEIIGVLADENIFVKPVEIWRPLAANPLSDDRDNHFLATVGRLKSNVTAEQAESEMQTIAAGFTRTHADYVGWNPRLESIYDVLVPSTLRKILLLLFGSVFCVLLIACANVANLLLSRALARQREISVRLALGARWRHVFMHVFSETALLAFGGTIGGVILAMWGVAFLRASLPDDIRGASELAIDGPSLAFAAGACVLATLLAGIIPALRTTKGDPAAALSGGTRTVGTTPRRHRTRSLLVVGQFALCTVLLVSAGLLLKSFSRLQNVDPGFTASGLLSFKISPNPMQYGEEKQRLGLFQEIRDRAKTLPGVTGVTLTSGVPFDTTGRTGLNLFPHGPSALNPGESIQAHWRIVGEDYFKTMEVPILSGRAFNRMDTTQSAPAIIISERLAQDFWPGEDAVGKLVDPGGGGDLRTVVGVVRDLNLRDLSGDTWPAMYLPLSQWWGWDTFSIVVRTNRELGSLGADVRSLMHEIDPSQPIFDLRTVENIVSTQLQPSRLNSSLLVIFAALALILAAVGIYGAMATGVVQRRNEIGIRMALGAQVADIMNLVFRQGLRLAAFGLVAGLFAAFAATRLLTTHLYETAPTDPLAYVATIVALGGAASLACYLPARRAARVDPMVALRSE